MNAKSSLKTRLARFFRTKNWSFKPSLRLPFMLSVELSVSKSAL